MNNLMEVFFSISLFFFFDAATTGTQNPDQGSRQILATGVRVSLNTKVIASRWPVVTFQ